MVILSCFFLVFYLRPFDEIPQLPDADTTALTEPLFEYGLPIDSFNLTKGYIPDGANLTTVLSPLGVSPEIIAIIASGPDSVFNVKRIRAGNRYCMFSTRDSLSKPCYFVYEQNITDFIVIDIRDSVRIEKKRKEIKMLNRKVVGAINSSLWNAMEDVAVSPQMALRLSDVYAWTIDFFGIQKGDSFRVLFTELYVDTTFAGFGDIEAAWFKHNGTEYYAIPFIQDGDEGFYNKDGSNLRKAFLKAPLSFSRISSHFSNSRYHPVLKYYRPHHGVDYSAPRGTPVYSIGDGTVIYKGWSGGGGKTVKITHNSVYTTSYMHLSGYAKGLSEGKRVKQGELIGYVGSTGLSTGPHLDFRVYMNGSPVNPLTIEAPPSDPVKKENVLLFRKLADSLSVELQKIK
ncbi:MAG: metalloendopeptidase [Bacteroidetes bacterium HGW-Bacteroidetes-21]|nr:MAG: metalloendopeptidase [Bacteroidetes bacterium HGW-Bacteroidetes-21]